MDSSFEACDFVLFGTKGDLSRRKLLPSLYQLEKAGLLHPDTKIVGVARQEHTTEEYVEEVHNALTEFGGETLCENTWNTFKGRLAYAQIDMKDIASYAALESHVDPKRTMVCYLATPPAIYGDICRGLHGCNIIDSSVRLVLEKPIGHDLKSSKVINDGYANYGMYLKRALEKLKVNMHIFRVGTFKSAVEPYIREDMSDAAKEMNKRWLNQYWEQYKADVAAARGVDISNFDETMDEMLANFEEAGGNSAQYAILKGWVDEVKTREEVRQEIIAMVGDDDNRAGFKMTSYRDYNRVINPPVPMAIPHGDKVAVVVAKGTIMDGEQQAGNIGGNSTAELLRQARLDDDVKAVVLQVDSPGGSASASEIIRQEVLNLRAAGKPVVVSMNTYAASGGYWISASADKIFASPSTITGSIGVFAALATFEKAADYLGVDTDGVATTEMAGFSPLRGIDPQYSQLIQRSIESKYAEFLTLVASERKMNVSAVDEIAQGRVWIGTDALQLGLIDELGTLDDAVTAAAALAEVEDFDTVYITRKLTQKELFWKEFFGQAVIYAVKLNLIDSNNMLTGLVKETMAQVDLISSLNDPQNIYTLCIACRVVDNH